MRFWGSKIVFIKKFRPKYGGMQNLRKIVKAVLAEVKNALFVSLHEKPPLWHFHIRLIMQEEKVFRNFISFSLRSKEMLASLARNSGLRPSPPVRAVNEKFLSNASLRSELLGRHKGVRFGLKYIKMCGLIFLTLLESFVEIG